MLETAELWSQLENLSPLACEQPTIMDKINSVRESLQRLVQLRIQFHIGDGESATGVIGFQQTLDSIGILEKLEDLPTDLVGEILAQANTILKVGDFKSSNP